MIIYARKTCCRRCGIERSTWLYLCTNHGKQPCSTELNSTSGGQVPLKTCFPLSELKALIKIYKASGSENDS